MKDDEHRGRSSLIPPDNELLGLIFESAIDFGIFTLDPNGITTSWNSGAERLLGYKSGEIIGKSADLIFPPEEGGLDAAAEERRTALAQGRAEDERWQMRKDGTRFWASGLLMPLADRNAGFLKILRDRTGQHRAEEQLRESEERFRILATNIPQLVFRSMPNGERTWPSPQWTSFTGLGFADSVGLGWLDAVHPDDRTETQAAWREALGNDEYYIEHRVRRAASGEYRWHQTRAVPLAHSANPAATEWVGTMTDIHELRMLQDRQKVLLAEVQHRTRNLLAVVQSLARQTMKSTHSAEEFAQEYEGRLGALSRIQALLARTDNEPIDMRELVEGELEAHGHSQLKGSKVKIEGPSVLLPSSTIQLLSLALHELATNAVKYGALGQPSGQLIVRWEIKDQSPDPLALVVWRESGVAMPQKTPMRKGYGSELIERALPFQLGARTSLEFEPDGVHCEIIVPITTKG
ncbi:PAS domain S-box protein [Bradyrhizobium sp. S3.5.5]|uniref:sensor histidine kinase n=1 Tax=Bradyrhizobium sp. S3.5.5 TaxID=3156430 RepID=UPI003398CBEC